LRAIGTDANSARSLGAAIYVQNAKVFPLGTRYIWMNATFSATDLVIGQLGYSPKRNQREVKGQIYMLQGISRAAKEAGDEKTVEYISKRIQQLKEGPNNSDAMIERGSKGQRRVLKELKRK
jgi:hypothetical protein